MASNVINHEVVLDKIPDKHSLVLNVRIKLSWKFKLRMKVGLWLIKLGAWVVNVGIETHYDNDDEM